MSAQNHGGCAFPADSMPSIGPNGRMPFSPGMTLRDYFASKAMQGLVASADEQMTPSNIARAAYLMADAMLKAREAQS